jgi:hypothetical protein
MDKESILDPVLYFQLVSDLSIEESREKRRRSRENDTSLAKT